jgi:hypothetical protein
VLASLLLSLAVEAPAAALFVVVCGWGSARRAAGAAILGTLATHWLAWRLAVTLIEAPAYPLLFVAIEASVVLLESIAYRLVVPLKLPRALMTSLVANGASVGLGLLLTALDWM